MRFEVDLKKGAGPIKFGMTIEHVRALFNETPNSFRRTPQSMHPLDYFESQGLFVIYDSRGAVEALEFDDSAKLTLKGTALHEFSPQNVKLFIQDRGGNSEDNGDSITSYELGLSFWFPDREDEPIASARSVLVFCEGYFDR